MNSKKSRAEQIAKIMVANMRPNMKNPNFLEERVGILQKTAKKAIVELRKRENENNVSKEKVNS